MSTRPERVQDVSGGSPVMVAGTDVPLWGMEIDPDESTKRFRASSAADKGQVSPAAGDSFHAEPELRQCFCHATRLSFHDGRSSFVSSLGLLHGDKGWSSLWLGWQGVKNFLGGMGLGMIANQLADLKLGELLDTPPPGLDEAVAIAKV